MLLAELQRCLDAGLHESAVSAADALLAAQRRSFPARLGRARANLSLGRVMDADQDVAEALRLMPQDLQAGLIRAQIDHRLGRVDPAVERLRALSRVGGALGIEATVVLSEVLHFAHRHADLAALVAAGGAWSKDPRSALAAARVMARERPSDAIEALRPLACAAHGPVMHRVAGFEMVQLLDRMGRFREAFDLAATLHAATTPPYDLEGLLLGIRDQREMVERGGPAFRPRCAPVEGVAIMVALPRSGTTLLEQMLDRHPAVAGIGEYEGIERVGAALVSTGLWPRGLGMLQPAAAAAARGLYVDPLARMRRPGAAWSLDKTLCAWQWIPALACVLPGARCIHVERDPRDMAISMFLSFFNPRHYGWMSSLGSIRLVIEAHRSFVRPALSALGVPHECVPYERLVEDPAGHARRCLDLLGLPMDPAVLAPEGNARAVYTLSHEQVRRPINAASIDRWRNYAWAFDGSWD
jgi:hypothetical protein